MIPTLDRASELPAVANVDSAGNMGERRRAGTNPRFARFHPLRAVAPQRNREFHLFADLLGRRETEHAFGIGGRTRRDAVTTHPGWSPFEREVLDQEIHPGFSGANTAPDSRWAEKHAVAEITRIDAPGFRKCCSRRDRYLNVPIKSMSITAQQIHWPTCRGLVRGSCQQHHTQQCRFRQIRRVRTGKPSMPA